MTLAVARFYTGYSPKTDAVFEQALKDLKAQGATLVDVKDFDEGPIGKAEGVVLYTELKVDLAAYLASTDPRKVPSRTLADLIAFNKATPEGVRMVRPGELRAGREDQGPTAIRSTSRPWPTPSGWPVRKASTRS